MNKLTYSVINSNYLIIFIIIVDNRVCINFEWGLIELLGGSKY